MSRTELAPPPTSLDQQVNFFEEQGYLHIPACLDRTTADLLEAEMDRIREACRADRPEVKNLFFPDFVGRSERFAELVDHPAVLPVVAAVLGYNIYLYHSHLGITEQERPTGSELPTPLGWHQDSGRVNLDMETVPRPRLSLKASFWISDVSETDRGNFYIIPGSHRSDTMELPEKGLPERAMAVTAGRGDVVLFDRRLWHARSHNRSPVTRKVLFYGYGYRWIRTKDEMTIPQPLLDAANPVRQQLLGGTGNCNQRYRGEEAPLKEWMEEQGIPTDGPRRPSR